MASVRKLSKLWCGDEKRVFYLLTVVDSKEKTIRLTLTNGAESWNGKITEDEMVSWSDRTKLSLTDYRSQTMKALSGEKLNGNEFDYEVNVRKDDSADFIWKRVIKEENIKFQLGCVRFKPDVVLAESTSKILEFSVESIESLEERIRTLADEKERLATERTVALQNLEKFVSIKEDTEKDLYSKFVVVLNEKKAKIRELKNKLESRSEIVESSLSNHPSHHPLQSSGSKAMKDARSDSDASGEDEDLDGGKMTRSDDDYDTDTESTKRKTKNLTDVRKNMIAKNDDVDDDVNKLLLGDDDDDGEEEAAMALLPKRARQSKRIVLSAPPKKILSKANLRNAESDADGKNLEKKRSSVGSLRKSASKASNSSNIDANDLIDKMD